MKMKKVIYRQSTSGNEKVFPSSRKSLGKVYGKSLGKVYGKKACSMIHSDGNTSFLVQYTSITMQIKTFTNFCKPNVINLRLI